MTAAIVPPARKATADDAAASEAKRHYEEGTKAFNLGEFPRAIAEFKATYNAKPDPLLLYNIAQSYRLAGDAGQALFFYKSFLRNMPGATNRKEVEAQIRKLEKQVQAQGPTDEQKRESAPGTAAVGAAPPRATTTAPPPVTSPAPDGTTVPAVRPARAAVPIAGPPSPVESPGPAPSTTPPPAPAPPPTQEPQVDLSTPAPAPQEEERPIYKKWWFWAGAAGAVLIIGGIASANAKKSPNTTLGTYDPTFQ